MGGTGGDGAPGGSATASATTTTASASQTAAVASASGGTGGAGAEGGELDGPGGTGADGGAAEGTRAVDVNPAGAAYAYAIDVGGMGGGSAGDTQLPSIPNYQGRVYPAGNGGAVANTTASAIGATSAIAEATQDGGEGNDGPQGGAGAASSLTNAVTGSTMDGALTLDQVAQGGAGGGGFAGKGGQGGAATSDLTFDDTASPTQSATIAVQNDAYAGAGGLGAIGAVAGVDASSDTTVTGAQDVRVTAYTVGGAGGPSGAFTVSNASGTGGAGGDGSASASGITTSATGNVSVDLDVIGGAGGNAEDGAYAFSAVSDGGAGGQAAIGAASGTGGASAEVEATLRGGAGGTSDGAVGGTGADGSLINAVTGSTHGGTLTLDQTATGGAGGDSFGGTGGQGGSATSDLTFDDTANTNQSAMLEVDLQAQAGQGGFDQSGANPGFNQVGTSSQLSGDGGSAVARGNITAAPALASGTPTEVDLSVSAFGNRGLAGGDASAGAAAVAGTVNVGASATAGDGFEQTDFTLDKAGTATAVATATDAGGTAAAFATSGLSNQFGDEVSNVSGSASADVFSTSTVKSLAGYNQVGRFDTSAQAVADVIGLPSAAMGGTDAGPGQTLLFDTEQGSSGLPGATGSQTTTTLITAEFDLSQFNTGSEFLLDLHQAVVMGSGVTGVTFDLTGLDTAPLHEAFTSAASAAAFFTNDVIDLGSFNAVTGDSNSLFLQTQLAVTTDDATSGFYAEIEGAGVACYCPGTSIRTVRGPVPIEALRIGDQVATLHGPAQPIKWIGRRSYDGRFVAGQVLMLPVCVKRHAIAPGVPARDLYLSPGHALYLDGVLLPVWLLVNGTSITQAAAADSVTYLHLEFDTHEVIFAEDCPAESFVDDRCRNQFANAAEHRALYPDDPATPPPLCAIRVEDGFVLQAIQARLAARAGLQPPAAMHGPLRGFVDQDGPVVVAGWAQDLTQPERPVCLDILAGGRRLQHVLANRYRPDLRQAGLGSGKHGFAFTLPPHAAGMLEVRRAVDGAVLAPTEAAIARRGIEPHRRVA